jgi:hypothetical protein
VVVTITPANVAAINTVLDHIRYAGPRISTGITPTGYDSTNFFLRADHQLNADNLLTALYSCFWPDRRAGFSQRGHGFPCWLSASDHDH